GVGAGGGEHGAIAVRQYRERVAFRPQLFECGYDSGKRLELLDLAHERAPLVRRVADAAAIHHVSDRALSDLPIGRVLAIAQRIDHRVLEMRAAPPGDEAVRLAVPTLTLEERRDGLGQPLLHIDDGAVLVERQRLDLASEHL